MEGESETLYWCPAQTRADRWHAVRLLLLRQRGGLGELILKVYFIEFSSLWKTCGSQQPMGREEEIRTNNFCLVELDPVLRIFNMEPMIHLISFSHFHQYLLHRHSYDLSVHPISGCMSNCKHIFEKYLKVK